MILIGMLLEATTPQYRSVVTGDTCLYVYQPYDINTYGWPSGFR